MAKKTTLNIRGMTCQMCVKHVTKALMGVQGVSEVVVSLDENNAQVTYDESLVDTDNFKTAVSEAGYEVTA